MKYLMILVLIILNAPAAVAAPQELVPRSTRFRIGERVIVDRKINMQTQFVVDDQDTAFLMSYYANHDAKTLRVSRPHQVKQGAMYMGWPYILDKKGRLFALSLSQKTRLKAKLPIVAKHWLTKFPKAAGIGFFIYAGAWANVWMHGGDIGMDYPAPSSFGLSAIAAYYITDGILTTWFRSHQKLNEGGNFFTHKVAEGVDSLEFDPHSEDYIVRYISHSQSSHFLGDLATAESRRTHCIYLLTKLVNE